MVAGPREQLRPTTSAPAASSRRAASATLHPSRIRPSRGIASVITAGFPERRIASSARSASPPELYVSPTMKSTPASTAQPICSSKMRRACWCDFASSGP